MSSLRLFLFGSPRLEWDNTVLNITRRKALALLIYLAVTGKTQGRDTLATLFWPDSSQSQARMALSRHLSELNKILPEDVLTLKAETVSLRGRLWLDVAEFEAALAACPEMTAACLPALEKAVALYNDEFLAGFTLPDCPEFDEWQFFQRESLRQSLSLALEKLASIQAKGRDFEKAIATTRRWLALDPLNEAAHRALIQCYAQTGQLAAALRQYQLCQQRLADELGIAPQAETTALYEAIRRGSIKDQSGQQLASMRLVGAELEAILQGRASLIPFEQASPELAQIPPLISARDEETEQTPVENRKSAIVNRHNLPAQTTPFIGRERELAELTRRLTNPGVRLVTILGPGGMGKTRLALEAATAQLDYFSHGVCFVSLAPLESPDPMVGTIAEALKFSFYEGGTLQQQLLDHLREKSILLVLDNFEHVLAGADLVSEILQTAPSVKILTTSRERLKLSSETIFILEGLDVPEDEPTTGYSAIQLFIQTACQLRPDYEPTADELRSINHICQLVQGMPLGIILAASWLELLSPEEIAVEIRKSLDFLETDLRDLPERQRSIRAVFDHSWRLLSGPEREVFQQLSVFRGGFTREAAEAVTEASLRILMSLANKSLLQRQPTGRFEVHELLRQYGAEQLAEDPARETAVRDRHCAFYCGKLDQHKANLRSAGQLAALAEVEADSENVRRAWVWAIKNGNFEAIEQALESLYEFYDIQSRFQEGYDEFGRAVAHIQVVVQESSDSSGELPEITLTKLLARQTAFGFELGRYEAAREQLQRCLELARRFDMLREQALCLNVLGDIMFVQGERIEAEQIFQDSLAISQEIGDQLAQAASFGKWGWLKIWHGTPDQAYQLFQQSLNLYQDAEHQFGMAMLLERVAFSAFCLGQYTEAEQFYTQSIAMSKELGNRLGIARALAGLGLVASGFGPSRVTQAKQLWQEHLAFVQELGHLEEMATSFEQLAEIHNELEEYQAARKYALEALTISKRIGSTWSISWPLSVLAEAAAGLNDFQTAWNYGYEALKTAAETQAHMHVLVALVSLAFLLAKDGDWLKQGVVPDTETTLMKSNERAIEILTLVMNHPAAWQVYKDKAARLRAELEAELPLEVVASAVKRGKARDLDETVQEFLAELGGSSTNSGGDTWGRRKDTPAVPNHANRD